MQAGSSACNTWPNFGFSSFSTSRLAHVGLQAEACSPVYNVEKERDRALCLLASINLHRLVKVLLTAAPAPYMRALQGAEDWQPSLRVHTCIIRHKTQVHKLVYQLDSFLQEFGHSFDCIQVSLNSHYA